MREEKIRRLYRETFDEVHASDEMLRKVINMKDDKKTGIKRISKRVACTAAALAAVALISSNAVAYAATGSTWVEKIKYSIAGKDYEATITKSDSGDVSSVEIKSEDDMKGFTYELSEEYDYSKSRLEVDDEQVTLDTLVEGDRIYLISDSQKIDITDRFEDGVCTGEYEENGKTYTYRVTERDPGKSYDIEVKTK